MCNVYHFILTPYRSDINTQLSLTGLLIPAIPTGVRGQDEGQESLVHTVCNMFRTK